MGTGQTLLMVEDDETARQGLAVVLEQAGYVVVTAANGREALTYLRHHLPPLIRLDMMMPAADSWHFMRRRAQGAALASVPVLIMTAIGAAGEKCPQSA
jgi:CheY-like chemotaxis protein